jgi:hypothetical protein
MLLGAHLNIQHLWQGVCIRSRSMNDLDSWQCEYHTTSLPYKDSLSPWLTSRSLVSKWTGGQINGPEKQSYQQKRPIDKLVEFLAIRTAFCGSYLVREGYGSHCCFLNTIRQKWLSLNSSNLTLLLNLMLLLTRTNYSSSRSPIYLGVSGGLMELVKSGVRQLLNLLRQRWFMCCKALLLFWRDRDLRNNVIRMLFRHRDLLARIDGQAAYSSKHDNGRQNKRVLICSSN